MRFAMFETLDHLGFSTKLLDLSFCTFTEGIHFHSKLLCQFTISQDLNSIFRVLNDTSFDQQNNGNFGIIVESLQSAYVNRLNLQCIPVCETTFRQTSV